MKINKKLKRIFSLYNIAIIGCIVLIIGSLIVIFKPNKKVTPAGVEVVQTSIKEDEEITEEQALKVAKKQFKILGEKDANLNIKKINRKGEEYYYVTSAKNTMEIKIKGGEVTRINSATVEE